MFPLLAAGTVTALGLRLVYLFVRYIGGSAGTGRFRVESAALAFVVCGLAWKLARSREPASQGPAPLPTVPYWMWAGFVGVGFLLYWPALAVGLLSDDFVLVSRASAWNIGPVTPALFRPVPLFVWSILLHAGGGATALHVLNVVLHGTNAYLTARLVSGWLHDRAWSVLAGLLVLTAPLAPEAVVWCSGVFDVAATTLVLLAILVARRYEPRASPGTRLLLAAIIVAAVLSKETAAVGVGLVLVDAWARYAFSRQLLMDLGALVAGVGVFSLVRLTSAFGVTRPPLSRYVLQRGLFGSFGGFAVPWHVEIIDRLPWLPVLMVATLVCLLVAFFLTVGSTSRTRLVTAAAAWILVSIIPTWPTVFVSADLQSSRYLYLSAVGWGALMVVVAASDGGGRRFLRGASKVAVILLVAMGAYGTRSHLGPWTDAARLREEIENAARLDTRLSACRDLTLRSVPDSVRGAYVFRNGVGEAFARDLGLHVSAIAGPGTCAFQWDDAQRAFVSSDTR